MLQNIDINALDALKQRDPEGAKIIDTLLDNHTRIVASISHEVRNPLTLVYSGLQLISSKYPETKDFKFWDSTFESVEYMKVLLEELSTFNNSQTLNYTSLDTTEYLQKIALAFALSLDEEVHTFTSLIPDSLPIIQGDKVKLQEVILNILRNAKDAIGSSGRINLCATCEDKLHTNSSTCAQELVITISNNGPMIPAQHLDSIFDMFQTYKADGTGLGLAIAKSVMNAHGGSIHVSSTLEETAFVLRLPIQNYS